MALPMAHLLAAYKWALGHEELLNCPEYYLGSIAPDAIHIRDGSDKSNKDFVHFNNWRRPNEPMVEAFWREHRTPFDLGYGIHVLLDGHWAQSFRRDFPQILREDGRPDPELYYNDTCAVDRYLYEHSPLRQALFDLLARGEAQDGPFMTRDEFLQWKAATFRFYENPTMKFGTQKYITSEYTEAFIERCSEIFERVYQAADC